MSHHALTFRLRRGPVVALALLVACGYSVSGTQSATFASGRTAKSAATPPPKVKLPTRAQINAMLPVSLRQKGTLVVAGSFAFAPDDYVTSDGSMVGFVPDLVTAIAKEANLKVQFVKTPFVGVLTGIQAGRYDAGIIFADTKLREQQAIFVNFIREGDSFVVRSDYSGTDMPCGKSVGAGAGSAEALSLPTISTTYCVNAGKPAFKINVYPNNPSAVVALQSGRVDAVLSATDVATFSVRSAASLKLLPKQVPGTDISDGMALPLDPSNPQASLKEAKALRWACQRTIQSGQYIGILKTWLVGRVKVQYCTIDGAKS